MSKPLLESIPVFYRVYVEQLSSESAIEALEEEFPSLIDTLEGLTPDQFDFAYSEDKWSIKQVLLHMIDTERIMSYRALRFCRNDRTELPGYDQNLYAEAPGLKLRTKKSMIDELKLVRENTRMLFNTMSPDELKREGIANGYVMSAQNLAFLIAGHAIHHIRVIKDRYLKADNFPK